MKAILSAILLSLLAGYFANAQNYYYEQYLHTPLDINPALISNERTIHTTLNYHQNQYLKEFDIKSYQISFLYPLNWIKSEKNVQNIGVSVNYNNTGNNGLVSCTGASAAFTQAIGIGQKSTLSAGFQASYCMYGNSSINYTTGDQWVQGTGFDPSAAINETVNLGDVHFFTLSAGLNWHLTNGTNTKGNIGVAIFNINKPEYSFLHDQNSLNTRYVFHGDYQLLKFRKTSFSPHLLVILKDVNLISSGVLTSYSFLSNNPFLPIKDCSLQLGLDYRNDHTGVLSLGIEQLKYFFGISYAVKLSRMEVYSNYKSNIEFCFSLKLSKKKKPKTSEYKVGETRLIFDKGLNARKSNDIVSQETTVRYDTVAVKGEKYKVQLRQDFRFNFNDATLTKDAMLYLDDLAKMLKHNAQLKVEVIGHTDDVGTDEANLKISMLRAKLVVDYLVTKDINVKRLKITAKGKSEPIFPNNSDDNRAKNRRVEFLIYNE